MTPSATVGKGATSAYIQVVLEAIVVSSPVEVNPKCNEAWLRSVMSGIPQAFDSATNESGVSGALYKPNAIGVGATTVIVAEGFGIADGTGEEIGSGDTGTLGAQETIVATKRREVRMRARFVIGWDFQK